MEDKDNLFEQFRASAEKAETKGFDRMESVWSRVEDKLDREEQRKSARWWKYTGMAAVMLMFATLGTFLYQNEEEVQTGPEKIIVVDMEKAEKALDTIPEEVVMVGRRVEEINDYTYPSTPKITIHPNKKVVADITNISIADVPVENSAQAETAKGYMAPANGTIAFSGIVTDEQGAPLPGAIVKDGQGNMVRSDLDGRYSINTREGEKIVASYVGMKGNPILAYKANNNRKVVLTEDSTALEDVAVSANGSNAKAKSATAVRVMKSETYENPTAGFMPSVNGTVAEIDEGRVRNREKELKYADDAPAGGYASNAMTAEKTGEGLNKAKVTPKLAGQAEGSESRSKQRINNLLDFQTSVQEGDPLYVVDGVPVGNDALKNMRPEDILSITVRKDAGATAIYGSRAKDGVIIIKTTNGLTKKEKKKQLREAKKAYRETKRKLDKATRE